MAAATDTTCVRHDRFIEAVPMLANAVLRKGDIVLAVDASGFATSAPTAACHCIGIARENKDNTGGLDGAITVKVEQGVFLLKNVAGGNAVVAADLGKKALAYAEDNQTVGHTAGALSPVGRIVGLNEFKSTAGVNLGVLVEIGPNS